MNREGAKFCAQCAMQMPTACASCGSELESGARFCDQCGNPVGGVAEATAPADTAARKVVTILFADLVGSTSFGEQVDAESAREAMAGYHAMAQDSIEAAGGTVAKFIGDGVMALFGVPETTEDDAERAIAAGLALQRGFEPIRDRIERRHGSELGLRVGINTGEIVLADGDADLVGDAINTAARLEAVCTPGDVLVGEETWRLTRSHVRYEVLGDVEVKGKHEPVATYRVIDDEVGDDDQATPFVGRMDELALLRTVFDEAISHGVARLVTVIGAPGVGKTRISHEFCESLGDLVTVAVLRCERAGTATFAPIADLLRDITSIDDETDPAQVTLALRQLVAELDDADRVAELLKSFIGAAPARSTEEAFLAVRRLVEAVGRRQPLVVVVDDIQWAEPLFLDLLEHLAEWVREAPAVLVGLARPELRDIRPALAEPSRWLAATIALEGLDAAATAELAARLVGADSLPTELVARLPDSTEGNPLFVRELMRMLVDDGVIEQTTKGWQLTIDADAVEVPPTIQSLLSARLDRMPADERRLVELASVVGPEFALGGVAAIADGSDSGELRRSLDRLHRRELIESTGSYWGDEPIYRFHHVLIRDAAYRRLLKRARADLHLRVGEWTEQTAADLPGEHEAAIAYHYEQAHEYRRQLDDVDEATAAVGRKAAELLGAAAERALERDDLAAASSLAERSLARLEEDDPNVPPMLVVAAEALLGLGDVGRGRPLVERLSTVVGDDERMMPWAQSFVAQLTMLTEPDRLREAEQIADRAASQLVELGDEAGVAKARLVRAGALARLGQVGQCEAELDLALTAARAAGDRRRVAAVLGAAPLAALWGPSPIPRAGGRCLDVIRLLRITTGSPAVEATSVRCQAVLEALRGRFDTARTMLSESRATVEELGLRHALNETDLYAGIVELLAGDAVAAEGPLRTAYRGLGRLGIGADAGQAAAYLARAELQLGRVEEAEVLAAESAELAGENPQTAVTARTVQAEILAAQGRYDEAVAAASDAVERAEGTDIIVDHAAASAVLAQVAGLAGDDVTAQRAARMSADLYDRKAATIRVETKVSAVAAGAVSHDGTGSERRAPESGPWNRADERARRVMELFVDRSSDAWLEMIDPDVVAHHRQALVNTTLRGREEYRQRFPRDTGAAEFEARIEPVAVRGDDLALHRVDLRLSDGHAEWPQLSLTRWNASGRVDFASVYEPDDLAAAMEELDRLYRDQLGDSSAENDPWNEADRSARRFVELFTAGARDEWLPLLAHGHETSDRRPLVGVDTSGADGVADAYPRDRESRGLTSTVETVAVRGESFALVRWKAVSTSGREWDSYHLTRWTSDGLTDLNIIFPPDQLVEALAELERLWFTSLDVRPRTVSRLAVELGRAWVAPSTHTFDDLLSADFEFVDGRTLGMGSLDRAGFEAALRGREADGATGVPVPSRVEFVSDDVMVFRANNLGHAPDSGIDWEEIACNVLVVDGDRIARLEMFDEDRWDDAIARAIEVARPPRRLENWATRHVLESLSQFVTGDLDEGAFTDDYVREDRRRTVSDEAAHRDRFLASMRTADELGGRYTVEPLAIRGDRFGLCRIRIDWDADRVTEVLLVNEVVDDQRVRRTVHFDLDDIERAFAELDRLWAATLPPAEIEMLRFVVRYGDSLRTGDEQAELVILADDFVVVDHRLLGIGKVDRHFWIEYQNQQRREGAVRLVVSEIFHLSERVFGGTLTFPIVTSAGSTWERATNAVIEASEGRVVRHELFDEAERAVAIERARQLDVDGNARSRARVANAASQSVGESIARMNAGENADELVADGFRRDDRRRHLSFPEHGADELKRLFETNSQLGVQHSVRHIAVRGERLVLSELMTASADGESVVQMLVLAEFDAHGRLFVETNFETDRLAEAFAELDERWAATLDPDDAETYRIAAEQYAAYVGLDGDRFDELTGEQMVFVDHRRLGNFGELDRAGFSELFEARRDTLGPGFARVTAIHHLADGVVVWSKEEHTRSDRYGAQSTSSGIHVVRVVDGRVVGGDVYDDDDVEAAVARAEQLAPSTEQPSRLPVTRIQRLGQRVIDGTSASDFDAVRDCFEPDFMRIDRRRVVGLPELDRDGYVSDLENQVELGWRDFRTVQVVAIREGGMVVEIAADYEGGSMSRSVVLLLEGPTGRISHLVHYDEDDLESALSELNRVWLDTLDPTDAETYRIAAEQYAAYVVLDHERLDQLTAEDLVFVDRRTIGFGEFDRVGFFEIFETRRSTRGPGRTRVTAVHLLERGVLVSSTEELTTADGADGAVSSAGAFVTRVRGGRVDRAELFDEGQIETAMARGRELAES